MRRQTANECEAGHKAHDTKVVDTALGPFTIWDWQKYAGFEGYCTGQDDVSMTLDLYGIWEAPDWLRAQRYVRKQKQGQVFDFGSHIGWYAIAFAREGHQVFAVDADPANCELLAINARNNRVDSDGRIEIKQAWVENLDPMPAVANSSVRLIKSDVEGAENEVVRICRPLIEVHRPALLLECSPEFDTYYPTMIDDLRGLGYRADVEGTEITGATLGETQRNVWFEHV